MTGRLAVPIHVGRVLLVAALLLSIPKPVSRLENLPGEPPPVQRLGLGDSIRIESEAASDGTWALIDAAGNPAGRVARTLPQAADVRGYRGPTEAWIVTDDEGGITSVGLLASADTTEHVAAVENDAKFFEQFRRWQWSGPPAGVSVDAVSGATLTSMALAQGVILRIGGDRPSLVFADPITDQERSDWLSEHGGETLIRTGPLTDNVIGYQGPTELMLRITAEDRVSRVRIRSSFDNEPYVDYVRTESGFWAIFEDRTITQLAEMDPEAEGVEGVSGATMTSLTVADTLVASAKRLVEQRSVPERSESAGVRWTRSDLLTIGSLALLAIAGRLGWFRRRWFRRLWLFAMVLVIGLMTGNLVSMALVAGWSVGGIAWQLAPGLSAIAATAFLVPPITKSNPYCNHLCPHGAIQQSIRPTSKSRRFVRIPPRFNGWLRRLPGATLVVAYLALVTTPSIDVSSWEPFHAYLFRIAGWGSIGLAIGTLAISAFIPMGYCRLGCPTGRLIDYVRRSAASDRITHADGVAVGLLAIAWASRLF